jgi:hypothetical protein
MVPICRDRFSQLDRKVSEFLGGDDEGTRDAAAAGVRTVVRGATLTAHERRPRGRDLRFGAAQLPRLGGPPPMVTEDPSASR